MKSQTNELKKAKSAWDCQVGRCYREKNCRYGWYGAKGIRIEYSRTVFFSWYISKLRSISWKDPVVGRIDHSRNYSLDNIEMIERVDNTKERLLRSGNSNAMKITAFRYKTKEELVSFKSQADAAKFFKISRTAVTCVCSGRTKKLRNGISFKSL